MIQEGVLVQTTQILKYKQNCNLMYISIVIFL